MKNKQFIIGNYYLINGVSPLGYSFQTSGILVTKLTNIGVNRNTLNLTIKLYLNSDPDPNYAFVEQVISSDKSIRKVFIKDITGVYNKITTLVKKHKSAMPILDRFKKNIYPTRSEFAYMNMIWKNCK